MRTGKHILAGGVLAAMASAASAEVVSLDATGFAVRVEHRIAAPPDAVFTALLHPGRWWDSQHSWSGDAANMSLDPRIGGCFCEKLPKSGGESMHMTVIVIEPGRLMRMNGALGPFQAMGVTGTLSWELTPDGAGSRFVQTYALGGHMAGQAAALAPIVDGVMSGQAARLKAFAEKR